MTKREVLLVTNKKGLSDSLVSVSTDLEVLWAGDHEQALAIYQRERNTIQAVIIDWDDPAIDAADVIGQIHHESTVPVIAMVNKENVDAVVGNPAVNDYVTKPFGTEELLARTQVVIRRNKTKTTVNDSIYRIQDLTLNLKTSQVYRNGESIRLTHREFQMLLLLFEHQGDVLSRDMLLDQIWGKDFKGQQNIVDVYVRLLRQKIHDDDRSNRLIRTIRGIGYGLATK